MSKDCAEFAHELQDLLDTSRRRLTAIDAAGKAVAQETYSIKMLAETVKANRVAAFDLMEAIARPHLTPISVVREQELTLAISNMRHNSASEVRSLQ